MFSFSGESIHCYGLEIVKRKLEDLGHKIFPFDKNSRRPILLSLYWPDQLYNFIKFRFQQTLKAREILIGGNYPTSSPQALINFDARVFLGDGELFDGSFDNQYVVHKDSTDLPKKKADAEFIIPQLYEDVQHTRRSFVEMSRGCKYKCLFCQYGWLKPYREADIVDIKEVILRTKTKSVRAFAADRFSHTKYSDIRQVLMKYGRNDTGSDCTVKQVLYNPEYLKTTNKIRVGIEGISDRMRALCGKPNTNDDIVNFCNMVAKNGIKSLDFYMIYGMPTERPEEIEEFIELIRRLDETMPAGYTICLHWNAFTPSALTPFQWAAPAWGNYEWLDKFLLAKFNKRIKIYHKPKRANEWNILRRSIAIRATEATAQLMYNIAKKESQFKRQPNTVIREFEALTGYNPIGAIPINSPLPWDKYLVYNRETMLNLYKTKVLQLNIHTSAPKTEVEKARLNPQGRKNKRLQQGISV